MYKRLANYMYLYVINTHFKAGHSNGSKKNKVSYVTSREFIFNSHKKTAN